MRYFGLISKLLVFSLSICSFSFAQEMPDVSSMTDLAPTGHHVAEHVDDRSPHPVLSDDATWAPVILIIIGGMFIAAAAIGPIVHVNAPEEVPPAHSHDEPPGSSHHHGRGGTINPDPEDELPHRHH
jgi:hypothetical protein